MPNGSEFVGYQATINGSNRFPLAVTQSVPFTVAVPYTIGDLYAHPIQEIRFALTPAKRFNSYNEYDTSVMWPFNDMTGYGLTSITGSGFDIKSDVFNSPGTASYDLTIDTPGYYNLIILCTGSYRVGGPDDEIISNINIGLWEPCPLYVMPAAQHPDVLVFFMSEDDTKICWVEERDLGRYTYYDPDEYLFSPPADNVSQYYGPVYTASLPVIPSYPITIPNDTVETGSLTGTFSGFVTGTFWGEITGTLDTGQTGSFVIPEAYFAVGGFSGSIVGTIAGIVYGTGSLTGSVDGYVSGTINGVDASGSSSRQFYENDLLIGSISGSINYESSVLATRNLEEVVKTDDGRICAVYSEFNPITQEYEYKKLYSVQYT